MTQVSSIPLSDFEVSNFRGFRQLKLSRLGRVNLIVGKNNVGKTSLLEALSLYAQRGSPSFIWDMLEARNESSRIRGTKRNTADIQKRIEDIRYLFYGRRDIKEQSQTISLGPGTARETLTMSIGWYALQTNEQGLRRLQSLPSPDLASVENLVLGLAVQYGNELDTIYHLDRYIDSLRRPIPEPAGIRSIYVPANGLDENEIGKCWDNITLTELQHHVIDALRIIEPKLEGLNLITDSESRNERIPVIKLTDSAERIPLRSLGEGMNRLLGISLAVSNCADGILLIDEIESGLHYSVQHAMWSLVIALARRLNVQVFATTHSWDCIEGFLQATLEDRQEEGILIRLGRKKEDIVATLYDENELAIVTRDQIEVR